MKVLILNLFVALAWVSLTGRFTEGGLLTGFVLGYFLLFWLRGLFAPTSYFEKLYRGILFLAYYSADMVRSNLRVARDIVAIRRNSRQFTFLCATWLTPDAPVVNTSTA